MNDIRPLTNDALRVIAQTAATDAIPHDEANHYEPGTEQWQVFHDAYHGALEVA